MDKSRSLPLEELHRKAGAKIVEFAGWQVPVYYTGILQEHHAVREKAGLFDISHMGVFFIEGKDARRFLSGLLTVSFDKLDLGAAVYSLMTNEAGGIVDDVILYQRGENRYFLIVNAVNTEKDAEWLKKYLIGDVRITDWSPEKVLLALQGPKSEAILSQFTDMDLSDVGRFRFHVGRFQGSEIIYCRTGYTGEDGFEILTSKENGAALWAGLMVSGVEYGLVPAGFGARDSLRIEARYSLYGHELTEETSPLEAGLGWAVDLGKNFIGSEKIKEQKEKGVSKRLIGFEVLGRQIPREGYSLYLNGKEAGKVTSGVMSPTLKKNIALGYVDSTAPVKEGLEIEVRGQKVPCKMVKGHFYIGESLKKFSKKTS
jgi:aminomethyltransferase